MCGGGLSTTEDTEHTETEASSQQLRSRTHRFATRPADERDFRILSLHIGVFQLESGGSNHFTCDVAHLLCLVYSARVILHLLEGVGKLFGEFVDVCWCWHNRWSFSFALYTSTNLSGQNEPRIPVALLRSLRM